MTHSKIVVLVKRIPGANKPGAADVLVGSVPCPDRAMPGSGRARKSEVGSGPWAWTANRHAVDRRDEEAS
jgi:hypothetical protein